MSTSGDDSAQIPEIFDPSIITTIPVRDDSIYFQVDDYGKHQVKNLFFCDGVFYRSLDHGKKFKVLPVKTKNKYHYVWAFDDNITWFMLYLNKFENNYGVKCNR